MHIFILDLDGTLMPSHGVDNECYWRAVHAVFRTEPETPELDGFTHITDQGILDEWTRTRFGRKPTTTETGLVQARFLEFLRAEASRRPGEFQPVKGLEAWLDCLASNCDTRAAIATGGWAHTARFKLKFSGLARFGLPLASSNDAVSRIDIMRTALGKLGLASAPGNPRPTYIGDGPWDALSSLELGWDFIGIASGDRADALRRCGAASIIEDFAELARNCRKP